MPAGSLPGQPPFYSHGVEREQHSQGTNSITSPRPPCLVTCRRPRFQIPLRLGSGFQHANLGETQTSSPQQGGRTIVWPLAGGDDL